MEIRVKTPLQSRNPKMGFPVSPRTPFINVNVKTVEQSGRNGGFIKRRQVAARNLGSRKESQQEPLRRPKHGDPQHDLGFACDASCGHRSLRKADARGWWPGAMALEGNRSLSQR